MFPSADRGISMLPQLSAAKSLGENEKDALLHYYEDLLFHSLLEAPIISPDVYPSSGDHNRPFHKHTRPAQSEKKDRHSKIVTAQGPRDRRVRLSKEIARKFFDLQDLLGFDRASKTLDWLLTKSRTAIKEVTQMKLHMDIGPSAQRSSLRSSSECEDENLDYLKQKKSMCTADPKKKQMQNPTKRKAVANELRAKARARARERTKEKKFLREVTDDEDKKKLPYNSDPVIPINQAIRTWSQIESSDSNSHKSISTGMNGFLCFQPNLVISRESSSNFSHWSPNATENWDISSTVTSSSLCALSNMSSNTVLEISRKPFNFEEYSNNNNESLMW